MKKITQFQNQEVSFVQSDVIKGGVKCDVYIFAHSKEKDLGLITVQPGHKTPKQKVVSGEKTLEGWVSGSGSLEIIHLDGTYSSYDFSETSSIEEIEVKIGECMQWRAGNEGLSFYEICYPPYKEGRFENLSEN